MNKLFKKIVSKWVSGSKWELFDGYLHNGKVIYLTRGEACWYVIELDDDCVTRYRRIHIDNVKHLLALGA